jgi:hypothetical protein
MNHRKTCQFVLLALAALAAGCGPSSRNPLSDPSTSVADEKLYGEWEVGVLGLIGQDFSGVRIEKLTLPGYPPGAMKITLIGGEIPDRPQLGLAFTSELGGKTYLNICFDAKRAVDLPPWDQLRAGGFEIIKYEAAEKSVKIWSLHREVVRSAIERGEVAGVVTPVKYNKTTVHHNMELTDTSENLALFVEKNDLQLFVGEKIIPRAPTPEEREAKAKAVREQAEADAKRRAEERAKEAVRLAAIEAAKWRTWTTADESHRVEAKFVKLTNGKCTLEKKDGTILVVDFNLLSKADQDFIRQRKWLEGK